MKLKKKNSIKKKIKNKTNNNKKIRTKFDIKIKKTRYIAILERICIKNEGRERERNKNGNTCASNIYLCRFTNKSSSRHF
jgi:hypothetical protein